MTTWTKSPLPEPVLYNWHDNWYHVLYYGDAIVRVCGNAEAVLAGLDTLRERMGLHDNIELREPLFVSLHRGADVILSPTTYTPLSEGFGVSKPPPDHVLCRTVKDLKTRLRELSEISQKDVKYYPGCLNGLMGDQFELVYNMDTKKLLLGAVWKRPEHQSTPLPPTPSRATRISNMMTSWS